jgi:hypothetical protein
MRKKANKLLIFKKILLFPALSAVTLKAWMSAGPHVLCCAGSTYHALWSGRPVLPRNNDVLSLKLSWRTCVGKIF